MIRHLSISNYVLIDHLELDLDKGLSIFTGETGSGKSILLGALALAMGERSDSKVLLDRSRKCIVELEVDNSGLGAEDIFQNADLEYTDNSILRRQIDPQGRSRAFINDTPVKLDVLRALAAKVVHVHSQHKNALISSPALQYELLDHFAGAKDLFDPYSSKYAEWTILRKHLNELLENEKKATFDEDYYKFQLQELVQAELKKGELEELEGRNAAIEHASELRELAELVTQSGSSDPLGPLDAIQKRLSSAQKINAALEQLSERMDSVKVEIEDLFREIGSQVAEVEMDPGEKERVEKRLDQLYGLQHKHRVSSFDELVEVQKDLEFKLSGINSLEDEIKNTSKKLDALTAELGLLAEDLTAKRKLKSAALSKAIEDLLKELGMPSASFAVELESADDIGPFGKDSLSLGFSANKGVERQALNKIASGGEISRAMLAMISLLTGSQGLPAVIFDEIDTGVSGDIASKVGSVMKKMAKGMQVICITHLPQIAGKADAHFKVYRKDGEKRTETLVAALEQEDRIAEIAQMLSGSKTTEAAINNAKALLSEA